MLESGLSGSVRGVPSNGHPYRDPGSTGVASAAEFEWLRRVETGPSRRPSGRRGYRDSERLIRADDIGSTRL
jgi:hypothetical protein